MKTPLKVQELTKDCPKIFRDAMHSQPTTFTSLGRIKRFYTIDFDVKLSNGENLQRELCWTDKQKEELVLSIIKGIRIPPICCVIGGEDDRTIRIIDGKQRLSTLISFYENEFPIYVDGVEYFYKDFDEYGTALFKNFYILAYTAYEPMVNGEIVKFKDEDLIAWFNMINFAGTPQDLSHREKLLSYIK